MPLVHTNFSLLHAEYIKVHNFIKQIHIVDWRWAFIQLYFIVMSPFTWHTHPESVLQHCDDYESTVWYQSLQMCTQT